MKSFTSDDGREWVVGAREEDVPRHHGRWYMVMQPADAASTDPAPALALPEVRWSSRHTAERTLATMSDFELRRRLRMAAGREGSPDRNAFGDWKDAAPGAKGGTEAG